MAVRLTHVCDPCSGQEQENEGSQQVISIGDLAGHLDLCEIHQKELIEPLRQLLLEFGRTEDGKPVKPGRKATMPVRGEATIACIVEGCTAGPFATRYSMLAHLRNVHKVTEAELQGRADFVCTARNCKRAFGSNQALAIHRNRTHGTKTKRS